MAREKLTLQSSVIAGNDIVFTVPTGKTWEVLYGRVSWLADSTVGTRTPTIELRDDSDNVLFTLTDSSGPTASATKDYQLVQNAAPAADALALPPEAILVGGYDVRISDPALISAGDTPTIRLVVVESVGEIDA